MKVQTDQKPANPLDVPVDPNLKSINEIYSIEDKEYFTFIQSRLENSKQQKNASWAEYNNKTYYQIYEENEKISNTFLEPKKNEDDVVVSAGTVEGKLDALLANINNLDLTPEVQAYDKENNLIVELGLAIEDTMAMTAEMDGGDEGGDEEKKLLRQRELLKQGTVFVQEEWLKKFESKKIFKGKYNGEFKGYKDMWNTSDELVFDGPSRTLLHGPNVFLGNMFEYFMEKQPFVFVLITMDYDVAKGQYGKFENWKYVKKGAVATDVETAQRTIFDNTWRLTELKSNQVEILIYQDQTRDEFQIIINGVMMFPIGFPLSAVSPGGKYNITKQAFRVINSKFAYGKSFVSSGAIKEVSGLIDEMLKLFVLKTRKSFTPAYINTSGRVISKKVLSPGRITMGIAPDALHKIGEEGQGVTSNEFNVLRELQERIDKSTVSNIFQGQQGKSGTTATEIVELQRQAKLTLGLTITVCGLLEEKLAYLRLWNLIENWFQPSGTKLDDVRKEIMTFRNTVREVNIDGEGLGQRKVIPTGETLPDAETIRAEELSQEKSKGHPVRHIYIHSKGIKEAKLRWHIVVVSKEKESSALHKLMFRDMFNDMLALVQVGSKPNIDELENEFSRVWQKNRSKLFQKGGAAQAGLSPLDPSVAPGGVANTLGAPKLPVGAGG